MKLSTRHIRYWRNFFFLKRNFWFLALIAGLSVYWFNHYASLPGDSARIQILLSMIAIGVCVVALTISLITTVPPYVTFWFRHHILGGDELERDEVIRIIFKEISPVAGWVDVEIRVSGIRKPLLGFLHLKIVFDDFTETEELLLNESYRERGKRIGMRVVKPLWLPHVKDYQIKYVFLHFEDVFHFFAFPYRDAKHIGMFTEPPVIAGKPVDVHLDKSEEPVLKVVQHKLAKGELIDYKKYAPGDDIRRIIWKNYARNRELTVRIPDRSFPYVSHINVLASFFDASPGEGSLELKTHLLNIYKEKLRQIVDSILEQGFTVQFIPDQPVEHHYQLDEYQRILYYISSSQWQTRYPITQYVRENFSKLRGGSNLLVFSSLSPVEQFGGVLNGRLSGFNLCFYRISEILNKTRKPSLIKQLFLVDILDPLEAARRERKARGTTRYVWRNETELEKILTPFRKVLIEVSGGNAKKVNIENQMVVE